MLREGHTWQGLVLQICSYEEAGPLLVDHNQLEAGEGLQAQADVTSLGQSPDP